MRWIDNTSSRLMKRFVWIHIQGIVGADGWIFLTDRLDFQVYLNVNTKLTATLLERLNPPTVLARFVKFLAGIP